MDNLPIVLRRIRKVEIQAIALLLRIRGRDLTIVDLIERNNKTQEQAEEIVNAIDEYLQQPINS